LDAGCTRDVDQIFGFLVCLPTAPVLPSFKRSGGFGTPPIYGQLSDKPHQLVYAYAYGVQHAERNKGLRL
jgi:hypothetical protein